MSQETLTFGCPVCHTRLTVPVSLAGVIGPCPTCSTRIQAPALPPGYLNVPVPQPVQAPEPPPAPVPSPAASTPSGPVPGYRPEPRQLPSRAEGKDPVGKPMPESLRGGQEEAPERRRSSVLLRVFVPLLFLGTGVGLVFGILQFLNGQKTPAGLKELTRPAVAEPVKRPSEPKSSLPPAVEPDESAPVAPPTSEALTPPDLSSRPSSKSTAATDAIAVLEKFLSAKTLEERLPLMEGITSESELQDSCLAHELRPRRDIAQSVSSENSVERSTDYFFKVSFPKPEGRGDDNYEVLVRRRGEQQPKVVSDPFLDLYGGRLAKFAAKPDDKTRTFQVLVSASPTCYDTRIPNYEKKLSLKLSSQPTGREIATAYAGEFSAIGEMLRNEQSGLRWGSTQACTIILVWNTKDDPEHPYLEASSIKALSWNP